MILELEKSLSRDDLGQKGRPECPGGRVNRGGEKGRKGGVRGRGFLRSALPLVHDPRTEKTVCWHKES